MEHLADSPTCETSVVEESLSQMLNIEHVIEMLMSNGIVDDSVSSEECSSLCTESVSDTENDYRLSQNTPIHNVEIATSIERV
jgi:hypothetical protein